MSVPQARRHRDATRRARAEALALVSLLCACAEPWDPPGLRGHRAALDALPAQRLRDATPYLLPVRGELIEFFCRWPTAAPLGVHLAEDASAEERGALEAALAAWEGAGLGVRFVPATRERADIVLEFVEAVPGGRAAATGSTLADCRIESLAAGALDGARVPARMARSRIRIVRRDSEGWEASDHARFATELLGVALHELAHALGFQGHARFGGGILAPDTRESTRVARGLRAGGPFREPTLEALYRLPSGVVLARHPVPRVRTSPLDDWIARSSGLEGPFVRVGDRSGRIFWRTGQGAERGFTLTSVVTARAHPERLLLLGD